MQFRNLGLALVLTAFSLPAALAAQPVDMHVGPGSAAGGSSSDSSAFNAQDLDQDGFISREEAGGTSLENRFDALDTDHDGRPSPSEVNAGRPAAAAGSTAAPE